MNANYLLVRLRCEAASSGDSFTTDDLVAGGLSWDTTTDDLREYFSSFGPVLECSIKQDPTTGRSRGFAFLVFESKEIVEKILAHADHFVKGRKVDPKPAHRRTQANNAIPTLNNSNSNNHHHLPAQSAMYGMGSSGAMSTPKFRLALMAGKLSIIIVKCSSVVSIRNFPIYNYENIF